MKLRLMSLALMAALLSVFVVAPLTADAKPQTGTATFQGIDGTVSDLSASFDRATGVTTITGTFTDTLGNGTDFSTTLLSSSGTCEILNLVLGPLDLNILGLVVELEQVELVITAVAGPGNLLGNLLCAVAGLLDGDIAGQTLVRLLNRIFGLLG